MLAGEAIRNMKCLRKQRGWLKLIKIFLANWCIGRERGR